MKTIKQKKQFVTARNSYLMMNESISRYNPDPYRKHGLDPVDPKEATRPVSFWGRLVHCFIF